MKLKKSEAIFIFCMVVVVLFICIGIVLMIGKTTNKQVEEKQPVEITISEKMEEKEIEKEGEKSLKFEDFNLLESVFMITQLEDLETQITEFLARDTRYHSLEKVICKEPPISTENKLEFYCVLGEENASILRVVYNKERKVFRFWVEEITLEKMTEEWKEKQEKKEEQLDTAEWDTEEELPKEWTYVEEDNSKVLLTQKELLEDKIPNEKLEKLENEIINFLEENNEHRRELEVQKSPKDNGEMVESVAKFKTPRIDKKDLHILYDKKDNSYEFALQEE